MEKSLNSSRNFKLPPIQGAAPAANILRQPTARKTQTWPINKERAAAAVPMYRSAVKPRPVIRVPTDPFPGRYRNPHVNRSLSNRTVQQRVVNRTIESEKSRELTLEFAPALAHQFPQTYTVLPPIQKIPKLLVKETGVVAPDKDLRYEEKKTLNGSAKSADCDVKSKDKQETVGRQKLEDKSAEKNNNSERIAGRNASLKKRQTNAENQDKETGERKLSATEKLFLKGKRKGRRVGVCLENEPALINITEQLKEIFLRRNMEEMYLI